MPTSTAPNRLREELDWRNISYREAEFLSGYSASYLCRIARGERAPSRQAALAIAKALGVTPQRLFGDIEAHDDVA